MTPVAPRPGPPAAPAATASRASSIRAARAAIRLRSVRGVRLALSLSWSSRSVRLPVAGRLPRSSLPCRPAGVHAGARGRRSPETPSGRGRLRPPGCGSDEGSTARAPDLDAPPPYPLLALRGRAGAIPAALRYRPGGSALPVGAARTRRLACGRPYPSSARASLRAEPPDTQPAMVLRRPDTTAATSPDGQVAANASERCRANYRSPPSSSARPIGRNPVPSLHLSHRKDRPKSIRAPP